MEEGIRADQIGSLISDFTCFDFTLILTITVSSVLSAYLYAQLYFWQVSL